MDSLIDQMNDRIECCLVVELICALIHVLDLLLQGKWQCLMTP